MEKESVNQNCESFLQWGNRKRTRCVKVQVNAEMYSGYGFMEKTAIRVDRRVVRADKELIARSEDRRPVKPVINTAGQNRRQSNHLRCSFPPEKSERNDRLKIIATRSNTNTTDDTDNKISAEADTMRDRASNLEAVWPRFFTSLSRSEKEEDFMAMKGSKLLLRPRKRARIIQRAINSITPGGWLCELSQERYEVREKKSLKKRPRGLKAMVSMESVSE